MVVAASLRTGLDAVNQLERVNPDVAVLDIEMPELDGISALPQLLAKKRNLIIIMASTLTRRNAEISFKALSLGASDYIPKPESTREAGGRRNLPPRSDPENPHLGAKVRRTAPGYVVAAAGAGAGSGARAARRGRLPARAAAADATRLQHAGAARAPDRVVDRRSAGADDAGHRARSRDRPLSGADHPAHAADLHHDSRRASGALEPPAGARSRRWRDRQGRPDLSRAGRPPHARRAPRRRCRDRARRRAAGQFLQARGRSAVHLRDRRLAGRRSGRGADRHGLGRHARRQGDRRRRRQRDRPGRSLERGVGHAGRRRAMPAFAPPILPLNQIAPKLVRVFAGDRS